MFSNEGVETTQTKQTKLVITSRAPFTARKTRAALRRAVSPARITRPGFKSIFVLESQEQPDEVASEIYFSCGHLVGHVTAVLAEVESKPEPVKEAAVKIGLEQIHQPESFAFRLHKRGAHGFTKDTPQVEYEIGGAIQTALEKKGATEPLVNLEDPDITIVAEVLGPVTYIGVAKKEWRETSGTQSPKSTIQPAKSQGVTTMSNKENNLRVDRVVSIRSGNIKLDGEVKVPEGATGLVLFAHGSGSSRHSPRNQFVARVIREAGVGTLLFDLLTKQEEAEDRYTGHLRFDIDFLARRLVDATKWVLAEDDTKALRIGYFGSSTGAAAALIAAVNLSEIVAAVVSRGGRPDLAGEALPRVKAPTLLIVGGDDDVVITLNEEAYARLQCEKELKIIPGATHLFEEPGTLEQVAAFASEWFKQKLRPQTFVQGQT